MEDFKKRFHFYFIIKDDDDDNDDDGRNRRYGNKNYAKVDEKFRTTSG